MRCLVIFELLVGHFCVVAWVTCLLLFVVFFVSVIYLLGSSSVFFLFFFGWPVASTSLLFV